MLLFYIYISMFWFKFFMESYFLQFLKIRGIRRKYLLKIDKEKEYWIKKRQLLTNLWFTIFCYFKSFQLDINQSYTIRDRIRSKIIRYRLDETSVNNLFNFSERTLKKITKYIYATWISGVIYFARASGNLWNKWFGQWPRFIGVSKLDRANSGYCAAKWFDETHRSTLHFQPHCDLLYYASRHY